MRRLYLLIVIIIGFTLSGCTSTTANMTSQATPIKQPVKNKRHSVRKSVKKLQSCTSKDPISIQVFPDGTQLNHHYKILGQETISKFNSNGIKRQEACIHDALRNLAASLGGDAVINITRDEKHVTGTIVAFDKKVG